MRPSRPTRLFALGASALPMGLALIASQSPPKKAPTVVEGKTLFAARCAPCHGADGKGGAGYKAALRGTKSPAELSAYIAKAMPPGQGTPPAQARTIAAWMHAAFYSPAASANDRGPRVEMTRLTAAQFRNAVADLMGGSQPTVPDAPAGGLRAEYFKGRELWNEKERVVDRTDAGVRFDYGTSAPAGTGLDPKGFSVKWSGSVVAPDTGEYEFTVRSDGSVRLYVNGWERPLVDGSIRSKDQTEFRGSIYLLAGRAYPLRLEFQKANQGVNDDAEAKKRPTPPAFVELAWRRPKLAVQTIPASSLYPKEIGPVYVPASAFPADDRSMGFERGVAVSKEWDDAVTAAALDAATEWARRVKDSKKLAEECDWFVQRAFRRGLDAETKRLYVEKQLEGRTPEAGAKRVALMALLSPRFLLREVGPGDAYATASNLSFALWDSLPDLTLQKAVWEGRLKTPDDVRREATRMVGDPRAAAKRRAFLMSWLRLDDVPEIVKSAKRYPEFDAALAADLRTSMELYLEDAGGDYRRLMTSDRTFLNGRLAKVYGGGLAPDAPFQAVETKGRAGLLAQPYLLSRLGYLDGSDPIHRGVLVTRSVLGRVLAPPPMAFAPLAASAHPEFTTRERVAFQTKPAMCAGCHALINPLGFTFEGYDAIGRLRAKDNGKAVDAAGYYVPKKGAKVVFKGPGDLARYLAEGDESHAAFVEKLFLNMVRQSPTAYGPRTVASLQSSFEKSGLKVGDLMVDIAVAASGVK